MANAKRAWIMRPEWKASGSYGTVGLEIVFSILFGFLAGRWLDGRFGTEPYLTVIGVGFGLATAARFVYRAAKRMNQEAEADGFRKSDTDRSARHALKERQREREQERQRERGRKHKQGRKRQRERE